MMKASYLPVLLLACLAGCGAQPTAPAATSHAAGKPSPAQPLGIIKLVPYRKGVAVQVVVNGKPGLFSFDTAGGHSIVSPTFAKAIGCAPWGQLVGYQMTGDRLSMPRCDNLTLDAGGVVLQVPVAGVLDVAPLAARDAAPIEGLLALDAFAGQTITIDFAAGKLIVESPASARARIAHARELPARLVREIGGVALAVAVEIPTRQGVVRFELDSGNGGTILVSRPYAALFGLDPAVQGPQRGAFEIAPGIEASGIMFTPELTIDGNLGMPFLKDWVATLDLAAGRLWLQPSRATPPPGMGSPPPLPAAAGS